VPESVEVHIIDRPGTPYLGTGEAAQGPTAAAIGNAVAIRMRQAARRRFGEGMRQSPVASFIDHSTRMRRVCDQGQDAQINRF
jgi:hypothetical protein